MYLHLNKQKNILNETTRWILSISRSSVNCPVWEYTGNTLLISCLITLRLVKYFYQHVNLGHSGKVQTTYLWPYKCLSISYWSFIELVILHNYWKSTVYILILSINTQLSYMYMYLTTEPTAVSAWFRSDWTIDMLRNHAEINFRYLKISWDQDINWVLKNI